MTTHFAYAQLANSPPMPQWIAASEKGAVIEKNFEWSGKLLKAILFSATETKAEIVINGKPVGSVVGRETAASLDVTKLIHEGANTLSLRSDAPVAVLLELNGDLARKQWIASDASWKAGKGTLAVRGAVDADATKNPFDFKKTFDAYNSWQLAKPGNQNQATDPASLILPSGFKAELVRSSQPGEDSWVSMAFDPEGRITLGKEKKGLLRLTISGSGDQKVEVIEDTLLECRGLLYAQGALFANANNSKGLYRLRDADGDGVLEDKKELLHTDGGVGHGRNHIKLGPDGKIYIAHGNNVLLPKNLSPKSPLKDYASDQLIPNPWDGTMFDGDVQLPAGHILRMNPDGSEVELLAGGLRNPLDIAFNRDGELFTFDADMERDVGTPWYMPTRVLHVVPGADYGWRRGTGRFPAWYIDTLPSVIDIGLSSPTGTFFGYGAEFPQKYREAYFILDWSYGRIIAVHLKAKGASYTGEQETFVSGRPLNVTDGCIGPDGAMWFITGGRGTQSGLYRVSYPKRDESVALAQSSAGEPLSQAAKLRRGIEGGYKEEPWNDELTLTFTVVASDDPFLAHAARLEVERTNVSRWRHRALYSDRCSPESLLALIRAGDAESRDVIFEILMGWLRRFKDASAAKGQSKSGVTAAALQDAGASAEAKQEREASWSAVGSDSATPLSGDQALKVLRVAAVFFSRFGEPTEKQRGDLVRVLEPKFPQPANDRLKPGIQHLNRELCRTLVYLRSPTVIEKTLPLLRNATTSEDLLFYPFMLRYLKDGWTLEARRVCFEALNRAEKMNGASTYFKAIADTRSELAAALSPADAQTLASVIFPPKPTPLLPTAMPGHTFKNWTLDDLAPKLDQVSRGRSFEKAKAALVSAQCVFCHKVSNDPSMPAGVVGPDLTLVSARFNRHDLLMHILEPSKFIDEKFKVLVVTKKDGTTASGSLESEDDERIVLKPNPLAPDKIEIGKSMIREKKVSDISPMPPGLLNALKAEQIFDILAWFEAGGDPKHKAFQP
ncbi:MAG: hypothetical protein K1X78_04790 [Verrucomicrobiaceae bacterium]|nr:hypothetical protein [Verrucomicrobiaceae bacterium]